MLSILNRGTTLAHAKGLGPGQSWTGLDGAVIEGGVALIDMRMAKMQRILVADDDDMVRWVMRAVLAFQGYQVDEAVDGRDAVRKYSQSPESIDLVMMDLNMPEMGGGDALLELKQLNPGVKAVMLSGGVQMGNNPDWGDMVRYLQKPFANDELVRVVEEALSAG